jgi:hypothetical protein
MSDGAFPATCAGSSLRDAFSVLTFRHDGARIALIGTRRIDGRTLVTADVFSLGHRPYRESWTVAASTVQDAVAAGRGRMIALVDELNAAWALVAA